jgi:hypothetical protein
MNAVSSGAHGTRQMAEGIFMTPVLDVHAMVVAELDAAGPPMRP